MDLTDTQIAKRLIDAMIIESSSSPLALKNTDSVRKLINKVDSPADYCVRDYGEDELVVKLGRVTDDLLRRTEQFDYSFVPLGLILEGEIVVQKGGKATKTLVPGDFLGLFETSDWLLTNKKRQIGDWTLVADSKVKVLYFSASALENDEFRDYLIGIARADKVPQPITDLPLLDWVASHTTKSRLPNYAIIAYTHLLPNNFPFFRHLAHLVGFGRMYVLEKPYSAVQSTYNDLIHSGCEVVRIKMEPGVPFEFAVQKSTEVLWSKVIEDQKKEGFTKMLIIDDGGDLCFSMPRERFKEVSYSSVQQTQRGVTRMTNSSYPIPPTVSVASSGIKKRVESIFIGDSVVAKLKELGQFESKRVGIIGMGSIGAAIRKALENEGINPTFYDPNFDANDHTAKHSIDSLFNNCGLIIGTTGKDSLKGIALERITGDKVLASASSADVEFSSLLKLAPPTTDPYATRGIKVHEHLQVNVLNGGYPINFDRQQNATPSEDIVLTRCLMYIGAMEAVGLIERGMFEGKIYGLDQVSQKKLLEKWIEQKGESSLVSKQEINDIVSYKVDTETNPPFSVWVD